ncbi:hypothetical protein PoB_006732400 [Plakobranchus ocellatus]|uniref:Uncharacterized protein n=1 Tax=Plakobranchus ocellatus TaxID=259542 RepID=A0AAV4D9F8_9GAST|nr:hypothetical protein PoB_006732400 [Plakobranchus ocellatus]
MIAKLLNASGHSIFIHTQLIKSHLSRGNACVLLSFDQIDALVSYSCCGDSTNTGRALRSVTETPKGSPESKHGRKKKGVRRSKTHGSTLLAHINNKEGNREDGLEIN